MTDDNPSELQVTPWMQTPAEQQEFLRRFLLRQEAILERRQTGLPTAQQTFASMMKKEVAPRLRELGFKGSGQKFRLPSDTHILALDFQRSAWNDSLEVRFTVNLSANLVDFASSTDDDPRSGERIFSHDERLGFVSRGRDHWWTVPADGPTLGIANEVIHDVRDYGIPWLREQPNSDFTSPWLPRRAR